MVGKPERPNLKLMRIAATYEVEELIEWIDHLEAKPDLSQLDRMAHRMGTEIANLRELSAKLIGLYGDTCESLLQIGRGAGPMTVEQLKMASDLREALVEGATAILPNWKEIYEESKQ